MNFINRVVKWNNERYKQEPNGELTADLLFDEIVEYKDAIYGAEVDQLDALVDIIYVAIGGMWKMGLTPSQINLAIQIVCNSNDTKSVEKTDSNVKANIDKGIEFVAPEPKLQIILDNRL